MAHDFFKEQPIKGKFDFSRLVYCASVRPASISLVYKLINIFCVHPGAPIYFLRRILHDWSDSSSVAILRHIADVMDRELPSRLVIAEQILPTQGISSESALVDVLMMTFTGMERTEKQWKELLGQAGLKVVQIYRAPGTPFGAVEAVLA